MGHIIFQEAIEDPPGRSGPHSCLGQMSTPAVVSPQSRPGDLAHQCLPWQTHCGRHRVTGAADRCPVDGRVHLPLGGVGWEEERDWLVRMLPYTAWELPGHLFPSPAET